MRTFKALLYRWISQRYMSGCSNYNTLAVRRNCRSKAQARNKFAEHNVPHAQGEIFLNPFSAIKFAEKHDYPLVIKPNVSGYSRGSYFPIKNSKELWRAIFLAKLWWPTTVVERYLLGANYRVLSTPEKIISTIRRYSPFVIGDGESSIDQLIDKENAIRDEMGLYEAMYPIAKSKQAIKHLKKQGLNLQSVPTKDQHVECFHRVALAPGGIVEIIDQTTIHPDNIALFHQVVSMFDANVLGIDVIFEHGIEQSYKDQGCIFIEVNSRPYTKMHQYPRYGKAEDLSAYYAELEDINISDKDIF